MPWGRAETRGEIHRRNWANNIRGAKSTMIKRNFYEVVELEKGGRLI